MGRRKVVIIILAILLIIAIFAVPNTKSEAEIKREEAAVSFNENKILRFEKYVDLSKRLGKVTAYGYLSPFSPSDGSFAYLVSRPYDSNITSSDNILNRFIRVYPKEGMAINYTGIPVKVEGTLLYSKGTDAFDLEYSYAITNCEVTTIEEQYVTDDLFNYSNMVANGSTDAIVTSMYAAYYDIYYNEIGFDETTLEVYETTSIEYASEMIALYDNSVCNDLGEINNKLITLMKNLNKCIEAKDYEALSNYKADYEEISSLFSTWCSRFRIEV